MTTTRCRAKDKSTCRTHGHPNVADDVLKQIAALESGKKTTKTSVSPTKFFGNPVNINFNKRNAKADSFYAHGQCFLFALALHERTGLPLVIWDTDESNEGFWQGHAAVEVNGQYVDVHGVMSEEEILARYSTPMKKVTFDSHKAAVKHCVIWDFFVDEPWKPVGDEGRDATFKYVDVTLKAHNVNL